uniref:Adipose-secreted signaling protein n=1 Tax=Macaca mulatta TaxID=9544 RepID=A0A5F7ZLN4_MACMU
AEGAGAGPIRGPPSPSSRAGFWPLAQLGRLPTFLARARPAGADSQGAASSTLARDVGGPRQLAVLWSPLIGPKHLLPHPQSNQWAEAGACRRAGGSRAGLPSSCSALSPCSRPQRSSLPSPAPGCTPQGNKPRVRSIRFAAGHDAEGSHSHVHFDEKLHDSVVMVTQESDSSFLVKVGFLKILHRYEITFTLPPVHRLSKDVREAPVPSLHLKLLSVVPVPEGYSVKCEYSAHKEGVLKEEILLACEGGTGTCVRVTVQARVMDRHHGTPMLLDGVKCVGAELEYDSEHSDWHGFD